MPPTNTKKQEWFTPSVIIQSALLLITVVGFTLSYEARIVKLEEKINDRDKKLDEIWQYTKSFSDKFESLYRDYDLPLRRIPPGAESRREGGR
jgi:hypothetical protein